MTRRLPAALAALTALATFTALAALTAAPAFAAGAAYATSGDCGGFPKLDLKTPAGWCVGLVARELRFARGVTALPNGDLIVAELGGWNPNHGRLSLLRKSQGYARSTLFENLNLPHGVAVGPDKRVYVGVIGGVFRFDPADPAKTRTDVIGGSSGVPALPDPGLHPLVSLVFDARGDLLLNVGSASDHCNAEDGTPPSPAKPCPESVGAQAHGVIRRYAMRWPEGGATGHTVEAEGLRNSLALGLHRASGKLWQGENSRDAINKADPRLKDELLPHDELNLIVATRHYGWPYCYDQNVASPEYPGYDCKSKTGPSLLLPPHAAPLSIAIDNDARLPKPYTGAMLLTFHGYRKGGHRLVAYLMDASGTPTGSLIELISGWDSKQGANPLGAPVGVTIAEDGSVFITEDRNGTLLRLTKQ